MRIKEAEQNMEQVLDFVKGELNKFKLNSRDAAMAMLTAEESIVCLMNHAPEGADLDIKFHKMMGNVNLIISAPGEAFDIAESKSVLGDEDLEEIDDEMEGAIRGLILRAQSDSFRYKNKLHRNTIQIFVKKSDRIQLYLTMSALLASLVLGMGLKFLLPQAAQDGLSGYVLNPIKDIFINALKMITAPVVFFSIVTCLSQFDSLRDLGKIGAKVMGFYMFTTVIAVFVGLSSYFILQPGDASLAAFVTETAPESAQMASAAQISILDTIIHIVPSNFVQPFLEANMLQIIFMAIICGVAVGMIGDYSKPLKGFFEACNELFLKITAIIVKIIPLAVLCSMTSLVMTTGIEMIIAIIGYVCTIILSLILMLIVYSLLILIIGRVNPLVMLKKHAPTMVTNFSLSSSNAGMPFNIASCKRLGISSKICAFSIPLGATVNMDGTCAYMVIAGLFLAKVYGVELDNSAIFSMIFSVIVLSVGAPGTPGSGTVCLAVLLTQMGLPAEGISLIMGVDAILSMMRVAINSTGDVAVSLIVARTEGLLDKEKYYSKS